ncbi:Gag-polypeptide of LTR copia-type [Sesbania bispinosa]|nr:Gag-polypeptide of LTR copia-type [Sesbania bispinosa]
MAGKDSDVVKDNGKKHTSKDDKNGKKQPSLSPYYLHHSYHPGINICPVILKGDNYQEWEISMRNAFRAKRKLGFLDGTVTEPTEDASIEDWWSVNSMLVAWVIQSINSSLRSTITYYDTVKELWDDLRQRFSIGNGPRILQLSATDSIIGRGRGKAPVGVANVAHLAAPLSSSSPILTSQDRSVVGPTLTDDQWITILNMFKSLNNNFASNEKLTGKPFSSWILDTGASYHMTGDKHLLVDVLDIFPSPIMLLDGTHTNAVQEGTTTLGANMTIKQDRTSRMVIGAGKERYEVYWLR